MKPKIIQKVLVVSKIIEHVDAQLEKNHPQTLRTVEEELKKWGISFQTVARGQIKKIEDYDLVITVGGDGTFLDTSHFVKNHPPLLGVNSNPTVSHGALCVTDQHRFTSTLKKMLSGKVTTKLLHRIQLKINGKKLPILALNDVLFANPSPAGTSRYLLKMGSRQEEQKSSGIWISTAAGSTAAIHSAGGKMIEKKSKDLQFVVRELFSWGKKKINLKRGLIKPNQTLVIIPQMNRATLFIDGAHLHYPLQFGDRVEIKVSQHPIQTIL